MMLRRAPAVASLLAVSAAVGVCMLVAPLPEHLVGWLPAVGVGLAVVGAPLGAAVARKASRHHRLSRQLRSAARPSVLAEIDVQALDGLAGAFVAGLRRPRIFCSPELSRELEPDELRAVLLHERYHQLDRAPAKLVVLEALAPMLGMPQAGRAWLARRVAALEIAADGHALEHGSSRAALARALLKLAPAGQATVGIGFASATELRLMALLEEQPPRETTVAVGWLLAPALVAVFCILLVVPG